MTPIPVALYEEWKDLAGEHDVQYINKEHVAVTKKGSATCAFLADDITCAIYDVRPDVCKRFGDESHPNLTCPYKKANGTIRPRHERRRIIRENERCMRQIHARSKREHR